MLFMILNLLKKCKTLKYYDLCFFNYISITIFVHGYPGHNYYHFDILITCV